MKAYVVLTFQRTQSQWRPIPANASSLIVAGGFLEAKLGMKRREMSLRFIMEGYYNER